MKLAPANASTAAGSFYRRAEETQERIRALWKQCFRGILPQSLEGPAPQFAESRRALGHEKIPQSTADLLHGRDAQAHGRHKPRRQNLQKTANAFEHRGW